MDCETGLLDLTDNTLLVILQYLDGLSALRLSLASHAAASRLGAIAALWRDLADRALGLPHLSHPVPVPPDGRAVGSTATSQLIRPLHQHAVPNTPQSPAPVDHHASEGTPGAAAATSPDQPCCQAPLRASAPGDHALGQGAVPESSSYTGSGSPFDLAAAVCRLPPDHSSEGERVAPSADACVCAAGPEGAPELSAAPSAAAAAAADPAAPATADAAGCAALAVAPAEPAAPDPTAPDPGAPATAAAAADPTMAPQHQPSSSLNPAPNPDLDPELFRRALLAHAQLARWHHQHCLRLARLAGGGGGGGSGAAGREMLGRNTAWQVPPRAAVPLALRSQQREPGGRREEAGGSSGSGSSSSNGAGGGGGSAACGALGGLTGPELHCLRVCDVRDMHLHGIILRCFYSAPPHAGVRSPLAVTLGHSATGTPFAWLRFPVLPARPAWHLDTPLHTLPAALPAAGAGTTPKRPWTSKTHGRDYGGGNVGGSDDTQWPRHVPSVWYSPSIFAGILEHYMHASGVAPDEGDDAAADATAAAGAVDVAEGLGRIVQHFVAAGRERLRCVSAVSTVVRQQLAPGGTPGGGGGDWGRVESGSVAAAPTTAAATAGVVRALLEMRAAGVAILDLAGVMPPSPELTPDAGTSPGRGNDVSVARAAAAAERPTAIVSGPSAAASGVVRRSPHPAHTAVSARERTAALEAEARWQLRLLQPHSAAAAAAAAAASSGTEADVSLWLREVVSCLPCSHLELQVLILPALVPRSGRAVRVVPSGRSGSKTCAPRLLQLMVPVLSELRVAMMAARQPIPPTPTPTPDGVPSSFDPSRRRPSGWPPASRLPRLAHVLLVVSDPVVSDGEAAVEAAVRRLAGSTMDRNTGGAEDDGEE